MIEPQPNICNHTLKLEFGLRVNGALNWTGADFALGISIVGENQIVKTRVDFIIVENPFNPGLDLGPMVCLGGQVKIDLDSAHLAGVTLAADDSRHCESVARPGSVAIGWV